MITFRPHSVSRPCFGQQKQAEKPIYAFIPIWRLDSFQLKALVELQNTGIITDVKKLQDTPELVRVILAPGTDVKELAEELHQKHFISLIAEGDQGFNIFQAMEPTTQYAFAI